MSFRMKLPTADFFADIVKAISSVVDEGTFIVDENAIRLTSMDPAHISLVSFELQKSAAEEYVCEKPIEISVSIAELLKFLRRAGRETLTLEYDEEKRRLALIFADQAGGKIRTFTLNALETTIGKTPIPSLSFEASCRLNAAAFYEAVSDATLVSDYTRITISSDAVTLSSKGDLGTHQTKLAKGGTVVYSIETEREVSATFSLTYLDKIVSSSKSLSDEIGLALSTNKPIKLSFPIPSGKLEFLIAPRIE
ncbi:MAG: proliferating cell nuclear antigen (pcna) [Nitrososphaerota archaeon]